MISLTQNVITSLVEQQLLNKDLINKFIITRQDIIELLDAKLFLTRDEKGILEFLYDYEDDDPALMEKYYLFLADFGKELLSKIEKYEIPYLDVKDIKNRLLTTRRAFEFDKELLYPFPIYISANSKDKNTIGVEILSDGKLRMFEGNDEASQETIGLVNHLLGVIGEKVKVYGSHGSKVIEYIKQHKQLPVNLYVSPKYDHAASYWGEDRILFSGIIDKAAVNQESEVDWKIIKLTNIDKLKFLN